MIKPINELGISPLPWHTMMGLMSFPIESLSVTNDCYTIAKGLLVADARIIAAAPALYECLREAVEFISDRAEVLGADCDTSAFVGKCRAVLAKAAGEEGK